MRIRKPINFFGLIGLVVVLAAAWIYYSLKEAVPKLYINELMANNISCCPDTVAGHEEFDDWIEIHNAGNTPVDIGGMYFSQHRNEPLGYKIPTTNSSFTTIQPGGYLLIWADGSPEQGALHLKFKLAQHGEFLGLFYYDGRTIDSLKFTPQRENTSYGRSGEDRGSWMEFSIPTPGKPNQ